MNTHSFEAVTPFARYDNTPWTIVEIDQAAADTGPWTLIDTQTIPADPTPETPNPVNLTTSNATSDSAWFRFRFDTSPSAPSPYTPAILSPGISTGAPFFTISELRAQPGLENEAKYPDEDLEAMRAAVEQALEHACDVAFVPRTKTLVAFASGAAVSLGVNRPRTIVSVTSQDGAAVGVDHAYLLGGLLAGISRWPTGPLTVVVEHGYDEPPLRVKRAALLLAKNWLINGPIDDRATNFTTDTGTFALATPGLRGSTFGLPEVDAVVDEYRETAYVA